MNFEDLSPNEKPICIDPESAEYKKLYQEGVNLPLDAIDKSILRVLKAARAYVSQAVDGIREVIKEVDEDEILSITNESNALRIMFDSRNRESHDMLMDFFRKNLHFPDRDTLEQFEKKIESIPIVDSYTQNDFVWIDGSEGIAHDDHESAHVWFRRQLRDTIRARGKFQVPPEISMENLVISFMNYIEEARKDLPESVREIEVHKYMTRSFASEGDNVIRDVLRHKTYQTPDLHGLTYTTLRKMSLLLSVLDLELGRNGNFDAFLPADQILIRADDLKSVLSNLRREIFKAQRKLADLEIPLYIQKISNDIRHHIADLCANVATARNIKDELSDAQNELIRKALEDILNYTEALCYPGDSLSKTELAKFFDVAEADEISGKLSTIYQLYKS